jgi:acetyltransferase-like isoleucine patch superfamily enzyme
MNPLYAKAVYRLRAVLRGCLVDLPRTLSWKALGLTAGPRTMLPRIYVTWPHQVSFGARCLLEHDSYFKFDGVWQPGPSLVFGDDVFIGAGCEFNIRQGITVGSHCLIASGSRFFDHDHGFSTRAIPIAQQTDGVEARIALEDDVWIGANVVVLKGVTIRRGAIVAAGSVVTKSIGAFEIWGGVPAKKLRDRPDAGDSSSGAARP